MTSAAPSDGGRAALALPTRVVVVDDQPLVRMGFRLIIDGEDDLDVVGEASNGEEALVVVAHTRPDVVLMDIRMPVLDGLEATRRLMASDHRPAVLIVTTFDHDDYVFGALRAGAAGFMIKDASPEELLAAVRTVASGESLVAPRVTRRLIEAAITGGPPLVAAAAHSNQALIDSLTERERDIVIGLAQGLSNQHLARHLHVSQATVKTHVSSVLAKLRLTSRVQAVIVAYETGLVRPGDIEIGELGND
jgi:DNA-binding NarL/FixJ family response regulator